MLPLRVGQAETVKGEWLGADTIRRREGLENPGYPIALCEGPLASKPIDPVYGAELTAN